MASALLLSLAVVTPGAAQDSAGKIGFADNCSACHAQNGEGTPGIAPPLVDAPLWQTLGDRQGLYITGVIFGGLTGKIEVAGQTYVGLAMPPHDFLTDDEVVDIVNYVLGDLNGQDATIDAAFVAATRSNVPTHGELRAMRKPAL